MHAPAAGANPFDPVVRPTRIASRAATHRRHVPMGSIVPMGPRVPRAACGRQRTASLLSRRRRGDGGDGALAAALESLLGVARLYWQLSRTHRGILVRWASQQLSPPYAGSGGGGVDGSGVEHGGGVSALLWRLAELYCYCRRHVRHRCDIHIVVPTESRDLIACDHVRRTDARLEDEACSLYSSVSKLKVL